MVIFILCFEQAASIIKLSMSYRIIDYMFISQVANKDFNKEGCCLGFARNLGVFAVQTKQWHDIRHSALLLSQVKTEINNPS